MDLVEVGAVVMGRESELLGRLSWDEGLFGEQDWVGDVEMSYCAVNVGFDLEAKGHGHSMPLRLLEMVQSLCCEVMLVGHDVVVDGLVVAYPDTVVG